MIMEDNRKKKYSEVFKRIHLIRWSAFLIGCFKAYPNIPSWSCDGDDDEVYKCDDDKIPWWRPCGERCSRMCPEGCIIITHPRNWEKLCQRWMIMSFPQPDGWGLPPPPLAGCRLSRCRGRQPRRGGTHPSKPDPGGQRHRGTHVTDLIIALLMLPHNCSPYVTS